MQKCSKMETTKQKQLQKRKAARREHVAAKTQRRDSVYVCRVRQNELARTPDRQVQRFSMVAHKSGSHHQIKVPNGHAQGA